jgi:hypothetical protein
VFGKESDFSDTALDLSLLEKMAANPPWMSLDPVAESIYENVTQSLSDKNREMLKDTAVGFLPTSIFNACCIIGSSKGRVIAINYGMFFISHLFSIALTAPYTTGELLQDALESVNQEAILAASVQCALTPIQENYVDLERHYSYMSPELLSISSVGALLMLRFILLHEIGHICNGDIDEGSAFAIFDTDNKKIDYINVSHRREYAADQFALNAYLSNTTDSVGAWAIFSQVEAFFQFLMYVERIGKFTNSRTHPLAISRLRLLRKTMYARWGEDQIGYMKRIDLQFDHMGKDLVKD